MRIKWNIICDVSHHQEQTSGDKVRLGSFLPYDVGWGQEGLQRNGENAHQREK